MRILAVGRLWIRSPITFARRLVAGPSQAGVSREGHAQT
jgi:hypothetical protein